MTLPLGSIARVINGRAYKQEELLDSGKYRVLRVGNFFSNGSWYYSDLELEDDKYCEAGDLLFAWSASFGPRIWNDEKVIYHYHIWKITEDPSLVDRKFLYYFLMNSVQGMMASTHGSIMLHLTKEFMERLPVHLPKDTKVQQDVASVLSTIDAKIDCNNKINAELESMAKMLYEYWFVQFEFLDANDKPYKSSGGKMVFNDLLKREIPDGWRVVDLSELVDEIREGVSPENIDSNTPYIGLEHISRKSIVSHIWSTAKDANSTKNAFKQGDILFGKIRPYFHKVWLAMMNGIASTDAIVLRPKNNELSALVLQVIFSNEFVEMASASSTGSKMPRADWKVMREYKVTLPPLNSELLKKYQEFFDSISKLLTKNVLESNEILEMRDWLLPLLMNGQVSTSLEESTQCKQS